MTSEGEKHLRAGDTILLVCTIGQMLVTWATLSHTAGVSVWKPCFSVAVTLLLTLAALTADEARAATLRRTIAGWLLAAPWILGFYETSAALWFYLISGSSIASLPLVTLIEARGKTFGGHKTPSGSMLHQST